MPFTRLPLLALILIFPAFALNAFGAGFGVGAHPVSPNTLSMWLLRGDSDGKPFPVLLVYFTGAHDWHNRNWESKFDGNVREEQRTHYRLVSKDVTLDLAISDDMTKAWIQNQEYTLEQNNVFVVKNADKGSKKEILAPLGRFDLPYSSRDPLGNLVLQANPELQKKIN